MEKKIFFTAAYDKRSEDPKKNYGVHGVDVCFVLKGDLGATTFTIFTQWYLPEVAEEHKAKGYKLSEPMPADFGYHSPTPTHENQLAASENCEYLNGKPCYYDGTALGADRVFKELLRGGSDAVWKELEDSYISHFGELK